ncbi:MAG: CoA-binding protein [Acidobacteriota bacterium]
MESKLRSLLKEAQTIAVVGISNKPERPSYDVAGYLKAQGYTIIPINPKLDEVLGEPCHRSLEAYGKPVDIVDIFRRPEAVGPIVDEAVKIGAGAVWMQEGVANEDAARTAEDAGMAVVQDRCIKKVLMSMGGRP